MNKIFYNEAGIKREFKTGFKCMTGSHARVYRLNDNEILKVFSIPWDTYDENMFKEYMSMDLPGFYEIYELLYKINKRLSAYRGEYCQKGIDDILETCSAYFADNLTTITGSLDKLANHNIMVDDLVPSNIIFGDNKITVIDIDNYKLVRNLDKDYIKDHNRRALCNAMYNLFRYELYRTYYRGYLADYDKNLSELFSNTDINEFIKKLSRTKYPMDYLERNVRH